MNKGEFLKAFASNANISAKDAGVAYDAFVATVTKALSAGEKIQLTGFATLELKDKPAREGINPLTKAPISIAASKAPSCKFGKAYKDSFNK